MPDQDAAKAEAFAKQYVQLTEALMQRGVPEVLAREEARMTATTVVFLEPAWTEEATGAPCPMCGRPT